MKREAGKLIDFVSWQLATLPEPFTSVQLSEAIAGEYKTPCRPSNINYILGTFARNGLLRRDGRGSNGAVQYYRSKNFGQIKPARISRQERAWRELRATMNVAVPEISFSTGRSE